jgi:hypothetical protein
MSFRQTLAGIGLSALLGTMAASSAHAAPVYIGVQIGSGAIVNETNIAIPSGNGGAGTASFNGVVGSFTINASVNGTPPLPEPNLVSDSISISSNAGGVVSIYMSELNQFPLNLGGFLSGFTNNLLFGGGIVSVTESTYVSSCTVPGNPCGASSIFATANLLATTTFTDNGAVSEFSKMPTLTAPYSTTEIYTIDFGAGIDPGVTDTISLQSVPEPMTLGLLGSGLFGLGMIKRRRSTRVIAA